MVLEVAVTEGRTRDFIRGVGRGFLEVPNQYGFFRYKSSEPRTVREEQGRRVGRALFVGTCVASLPLSIYLCMRVHN